MRLALSASPILISAALVGCSNSAAPISTGAVSLGLSEPSGGGCGVVGAASVPPGETVTDNTVPTTTVSGTDLTCTVIGTASAGFSVSATLEEGSAYNIALDINNITPSATQASPAKGTVSVFTPVTATGYSGTGCSFYFDGSPKEKVGSGSIWVSFFCDTVSDTSSDTCAVSDGVLYLEGCEESQSS